MRTPRMHTAGVRNHDGRKLWRCGLLVRMPVVAAVMFVLATSHPVQAAMFPVPSGDVAALIAAMTMANGNGEKDTITLEAGTYTLAAVDNETDSPNGLPSITSPLTMREAGAETTIIARKGSAPFFRISHVAAAGSLTLEGLTITCPLSFA